MSVWLFLDFLIDYFFSHLLQKRKKRRRNWARSIVRFTACLERRVKEVDTHVAPLLRLRAEDPEQALTSPGSSDGSAQCSCSGDGVLCGSLCSVSKQNRRWCAPIRRSEVRFKAVAEGTFCVNFLSFRDSKWLFLIETFDHFLTQSSTTNPLRHILSNYYFLVGILCEKTEGCQEIIALRHRNKLLNTI